MINKINNSEIINQKKQFIFEVDQTSDYVFPNEEYKYYIYIKNISGTTIENFNIYIESPSDVNFLEKTEINHLNIEIDSDEVKLYELKASCSLIGEHTVHFIGYGKGTQILHRSLKINCTRTYNSDTMLHKIHIYDFTPYEDKYTLEAEDYSVDATQFFKRQTLPFRPETKKEKQVFDLQQDFVPENIESQSFLDQYKIAKNKKGHAYQYLGRETFSEDSVESYTGENLIELFEKINQNSKYFRGKFFKSGTNHLLNDFMQYAPNGLIFRMGLLTSEIYHNLGVIPSYSYMSDRLFRWAPSQDQLLNLTPKKTAMKWGENVWAGRGWIVYKKTTEEYEKTEEFKEKMESSSINRREVVGGYEDKRLAEETVKRLKERDEILKSYQKSDITKYEYVIQESLYDTGVFFVNIPINKIPSNFYLIKNEDLYNIINRAKPYGTKPIINYIIEKNFNHHMDEKLILNYHKKFNFNMPFYSPIEYDITRNGYTIEEIPCEGGGVWKNPIYTQNAYATNKILNNDQQLDVLFNSPQINMKKIYDMDLTNNFEIHEMKADNKIKAFENILEILYQGNYNTLSFKIPSKRHRPLGLTKNNTSFDEDDEENVIINNTKIQSLKLNINKKNAYYIIFEDVYNKKYKIEVSYDDNINMNFIKYSYINTNNQEFIKEKGYENINSIIVCIGKIYNKKMLLFMLEDKNGDIHYFHSIIVQDLISIDSSHIEKILFSDDIFELDLIFETPFVKKSKTFQPKIIKGGNNWSNLYRLNDKEESYSFIKNINNDYLSVDDILLCYDQINIPETAIINKLRFKVTGTNSSKNKIYLKEAFNTSYMVEDMSGNKIQLIPEKIECYSNLKESSVFYQNKLNLSIEKEQDYYIKQYSKLLEDNYIFNEDIDVSIEDYLNYPNDFITIKGPHWCEISEFTNLTNNLNNISSVFLVIEGYNEGPEVTLSAETLFETQHSSAVSEKIPSGYFREKINLIYPNYFLLDFLRVRFKFNSLIHNIKIFDTKIELKFATKQEENIIYEENTFKEINTNNNNLVEILEEYYNPSNINNGTIIDLSFDDLKPGEYYHINQTELEIIYTDTDIDMMINKNKYQQDYHDIEKTGIFGITENCYLSGMYYNDVATMMQLEDNIGLENKGIKLQDTLYQLFETRDDNITSIELFPYGFVGNPDDTLKIGLYTNSYNTPGKLIKEVCVSGWIKNNDSLKNLSKIKYNININGLEINEKYWFKIQVLNPNENSYYLLKGINNIKEGFKLLSDENNNYINTFSNLKFNIYSRNLSKSFNHLPVLQQEFDNPYVTIGLHKGQGNIRLLQTLRHSESLIDMSEVFETKEPTIEVFQIIKKENGEETDITEREE